MVIKISLNVEKLCRIALFLLKKVLSLAKNSVSLRHAPAGSRVRTICRGVEPGMYSSGKSVEACHKTFKNYVFDT
jgi:hypothetical protein